MKTANSFLPEMGAIERCLSIESGSCYDHAADQKYQELRIVPIRHANRHVINPIMNEMVFARLRLYTANTISFISCFYRSSHICLLYIRFLPVIENNTPSIPGDTRGHSRSYRKLGKIHDLKTFVLFVADLKPFNISLVYL